VLEDGMMAFALLGAGWVLWLLVALSVLCLAISFERVLFLSRDGSDRNALRAAFAHFGEDSSAGGNAVETLRAKVAGLHGFEARVLQSGLAATRWGSDATEKAFASSIGAEKLKMDRGLVVLATVGSNAPFVGLFGTVLGIIQSFHDLAVNTAEASEAVMAGISEALVATAVGLLVAIPAVVLYNTFTRWNRSRVSRVESLANLVLSRVETGHGRAVG
jgi:biopolymer transport protein ExbB